MIMVYLLRIRMLNSNILTDIAFFLPYFASNDQDKMGKKKPQKKEIL